MNRRDCREKQERSVQADTRHVEKVRQAGDLLGGLNFISADTLRWARLGRVIKSEDRLQHLQALLRGDRRRL